MWAKGMYTKIFMVVLFVYNKNIWKPLKFPLIGYRLNKVWFMRIVRVFLNVQCVLSTIVGFLDGSVVKNLPGNTGDTGSTSGLKRVPGEGNGNLLQYVAWEIPWTEKTGRLHSMRSQRVGHNLATKQQQSTIICTYTILFNSPKK